MKRDELEVLIRLRKGDVRAVATRILSHWRERVSDYEEQFLFAHMHALDFMQLARWLAFRPEHSSRIVRRLAEIFPVNSAAALWHVLREAPRVDTDAWAELTELLAPSLDQTARYAMMVSVRGGTIFNRVAGACARCIPPGSSVPSAIEQLVQALMGVRYDDSSCLREIQTRGFPDKSGVGSGTAELGHRAVQALIVTAELTRHFPEIAQNVLPLDKLLEHAHTNIGAGMVNTPDESLDLLAHEISLELADSFPSLDTVRSNVPSATAMSATTVAEQLQWLSVHGASRRDTIELTLKWLNDRNTDEGAVTHLLDWLGQHMQSRAAWEEHGVPVLSFLVRRWRWDLMGRLCAFLDAALRVHLVSHPVKLPIPDASPLVQPIAPPPWVPALHEAMGKVLGEVFAQHVKAQEFSSAEQVLEAMVHLHLPPRTTRMFHALRSREELPVQLVEMLDLHAQLCRREGGDSATLEGVLTTIREFCLNDAH